MGRTPVIATPVNAFVPWQQILVFIEADRARLQPLRPARQRLQGAHQDPRQGRGAALRRRRQRRVRGPARRRRPRCWCPRPNSRRAATTTSLPPPAPAAAAPAPAADPLPAYERWLQRNVHAHRLPGYRAVTLSLKRAGLPPGDVTADQMEGCRRAGRPLQPRRVARHARPEPAAALGARRASCARCGWRRAKTASPRPISACSPT